MINEGLIFNGYKQLIQFKIKKKKKPNYTMGRRTEWAFFQRENVNGQQALKKMLNTANYQGNS